MILQLNWLIGYTLHSSPFFLQNFLFLILREDRECYWVLASQSLQRILCLISIPIPVPCRLTCTWCLISLILQIWHASLSSEKDWKDCSFGCWSEVSVGLSDRRLNNVIYCWFLTNLIVKRYTKMKGLALEYRTLIKSHPDGAPLYERSDQTKSMFPVYLYWWTLGWKFRKPNNITKINWYFVKTLSFHLLSPLQLFCHGAEERNIKINYTKI